VGGRSAALEDNSAHRRDLPAERDPERIQPGLGLSALGERERSFRACAIEQRNTGVHGDHAAEITAASGRRLRARDDFRLRNPPALGRALSELRGGDLVSQGEQFPAGGFGSLDESVQRRHGSWCNGGTHRNQARRIGQIGEEAGEDALRARAIDPCRSLVGLELEYLALGPKAIESRQVAGGLAFRQHIRQLAHAFSGGGKPALACLRRHEVRKRETKVGT
jgi:hypothetical protein